eukprot:2912532-Prymnesium_polylepis.1
MQGCTPRKEIHTQRPHTQAPTLPIYLFVWGAEGSLPKDTAMEALRRRRRPPLIEVSPRQQRC